MPSGRRSRAPSCPLRVRLDPSTSASRSTRSGVLALAVILASTLVMMGCDRVLSKQYEYEEEIYLSLDGTATVHVNGSVPALVALRGLALDTAPRARIDRGAVRRAYTSSVTTVTRLGTSRRNGRRFVHLRLSVSDIRRLHEVAPFAWSRYALGEKGGAVVFTQHVGPPAGRAVGDVGWKGDELLAFRMHLPSKIQYHNAPSKQVERGNILAWEQRLSERLAGAPVDVEVRLDTQSILYRTLWLFASMILLVASVFIVLITWIVRKGRAGRAAAA
jgi:hypothetical protein